MASLKGKNNPSYKDGRCSKNYYCPICKSPVPYDSIRKGTKKCLKCHLKTVKGKGNPMFGKKRPDFSKWVKSHPRYGQSNPNYIDGRSFYPYAVEFNKQLKARIRKRDNYTCQYCNMVEIEHKTRYNDSLTIHHIDYNKNNCHINNLITLCYICNSKANYNRDYWFAYFTYLMERE